MTRADAKKFLNRVRNIITHEKRVIEQINRLWDRQTAITQVLSDMPKGSNHFTTLDYVIAAEELQAKLREDIRQEQAAYKEILQVLDQLEGIQRDIMIMHYLMLMTWEEICVEVNLTYRWVQTLHSRALDKVAEILDKAC